MPKRASHLTSGISVIVLLIECSNAAAQEVGSSLGKNPPSLQNAQMQLGVDQSVAQNRVESVTRGSAGARAGESDAAPKLPEGDVAALLDALAQLRREHEAESQRAAEALAKRKEEEKPLLAAWIKVERRVEEMRRKLAGANAEDQVRLLAKAEAELEAEKARIFAQWADLKRKTDLEKKSAAEAEAKHKAQEARLLAALVRARQQRESDGRARPETGSNPAQEKLPGRAPDGDAKRAEIPRSTGSTRDAEVGAGSPKGPVAAVPVPAPAAVSRSPEQLARINRSLSRGRQFIKLGRLNEGRLFLERAANAGSAEGAFELAESYDPAMLQKLGVVGVVPDKTQAAKWYRKAGELGANGTEERVSRLGAR